VFVLSGLLGAGVNSLFPEALDSLGDALLIGRNDLVELFRIHAAESAVVAARLCLGQRHRPGHL